MFFHESKKLETYTYVRTKQKNKWMNTFKKYKSLCGSTYFNMEGWLNMFPDFFCMGAFIDSTHMKL